MKKLSKILIPSLSTLAIASSLAPLTSCSSKFDGKVTQEEWTKAFNKITDYHTWNFSYDAVFETIAEGKKGLSYYEYWLAGPEKLVECPSSTTRGSWFKKHNNSFYRVYKNNEKWLNSPVGVDLLTYRSTTLAPSFWSEVQNHYSEATFNQEYKSYYYDLDLVEEVKYSFVITFDSNKSISRIIETVYLDENNCEYRTFTFKDFGSTTITFPFSDDDIEWRNGVLNYADDAYINSNTTFAVQLHDVKFTIVEDKTSFDTIEFLGTNKKQLENEPELLNDLEIYINGTKASFTMTKDTTYPKATISGLPTLNVGDEVQIVSNAIRLSKVLGYSSPKYVCVK